MKREQGKGFPQALAVPATVGGLSLYKGRKPNPLDGTSGKGYEVLQNRKPGDLPAYIVTIELILVGVCE